MRDCRLSMVAAFLNSALSITYKAALWPLATSAAPTVVLWGWENSPATGPVRQVSLPKMFFLRYIHCLATSSQTLLQWPSSESPNQPIHLPHEILPTSHCFYASNCHCLTPHSLHICIPGLAVTPGRVNSTPTRPHHFCGLLYPTSQTQFDIW